MKTELLRKAGEIAEKNTGEGTHCVLGLIDLDGYPTVSTITASKAKGLDWIAFGTGVNSNKAKRIQSCDKASVCLSTEEYNITLVGRMEILTDPATKEEMWYDGLSNHFSGHEDPHYCVLKFIPERFNLLVDWQELQGTL